MSGENYRVLELDIVRLYYGPLKGPLTIAWKLLTFNSISNNSHSSMLCCFTDTDVCCFFFTVKNSILPIRFSEIQSHLCDAQVCFGDTLVRTIKYVFLPPDPDKVSFERRVEALLDGLFPCLRQIWASGAPWVLKVISDRNYSFCQFATRTLMFLYRGWLKRAAMFALSDDPENRVFAVKRASSADKYFKQFNCPSSSCRWRMASKPPAGGIKRCRARHCPHCHFRKVLRASSRAVRSAIKVRGYYNNLHTFVYEMKFDDDTPVKKVKEAAIAAARVAAKSKYFLGSLWYFRPFFDQKTSAVYWRVRLFVMGGGSFDLDRSAIPAYVELLRMRAATNISICKQVAKTMSWGKRPFWFWPEASLLWNQLERSVRSVNSHGCMRRRNKTIFAKFKKYHSKKNRNFFPHSWQKTGDSVQPVV